jgi:hypothetical protein
MQALSLIVQVILVIPLWGLVGWLIGIWLSAYIPISPLVPCIIGIVYGIGEAVRAFVRS